MLKRIGKYSIDLLVVAFGVLLGLYVSNWNDKRHVQSNVDRTLDHIISELESNVSKLERAYDYHGTLCSSIKTYKDSLGKVDYLQPYYKSKFKHFKIPGWKGSGIASMEDIAFESAKINGVFQELDISLTQKISRAYLIKDSYMKIAQVPLNRFLANDSDTKLIDVIGILEIICNDLMPQEMWSINGTKEIILEIKASQ